MTKFVIVGGGLPVLREEPEEDTEHRSRCAVGQSHAQNQEEHDREDLHRPLPSLPDRPAAHRAKASSAPSRRRRGPVPLNSLPPKLLLPGAGARSTLDRSEPRGQEGRERVKSSTL